MNKHILVIGKPNSGKTTFMSQLYTKIDTNKSRLKLYKPIDNLNPLIEAIRCLADGEEVKPTPPDRNTTIIMPLQLDNLETDLLCPDYGGEQINRIIEDRAVDDFWSKSIKESDNWIFFIRPNSLSTSYDLSNKTANKEALQKSKELEDKYSISDQSSYIELLQIMLYIKEQDAHFINQSVKLTFVLTCWDEISNAVNPIEEFSKQLPLLFNFIKSNWINTNINFVGLSSLEFNLKDPGNKEKYQSKGPENFGYLIKSDGSKIKDISELIIEAL